MICEESQEITEAFIKLGHSAISCDLHYPGAKGLPHYQGEAKDILFGHKWDLVIAHPPCIRICNSGVLRLYKNGKKENGIDPVKWEEMIKAAEFFKMFVDYKGVSAIENPIPHGYALQIIGKRYDQIIQPYNFGENASKATCLWLNGLPKLYRTQYIEPRIVNGKELWGNQTDSGQNKLTPDKKGQEGKRSKERSRTYPGIAQAIASQWSEYLMRK